MVKVYDSISLRSERILLTGGSGFLGSKVRDLLLKEDPAEIIIPRSSQYDLREKEVCNEVTKDVDLIIHLAAKVGGIGYNMENPGSLFYENMAMGLNLIEEARKNNVKKFVALGTI